MKAINILILISTCLASQSGYSQSKNVLSIRGTRFELNSKPFEFTGISFFNALYNEEFNRNTESRREHLRKFSESGINVLRIWCQWDNNRGFVDGGKGKTMYRNDGSLNQEVLSKLKSLLEDTDAEGMVVLLVLFSRESWNENIRLSDPASDAAVKELTVELRQYRNLVFQIWNEFSNRTIYYYKIIKGLDTERIVTNSPGYAGDLGSSEENRTLDYLSPHTTRDDNRHWEIAPLEINYLLEKFGKPVVDDEPARRGTPQFGGPKSTVIPTDQILHIFNVWKTGAYVIYHHDMFQTGYGSAAVPANGIPEPGFSEYHDAVFSLLKNKDRYLNLIR